jgi:hypothetical protein
MMEEWKEGRREGGKDGMAEGCGQEKFIYQKNDNYFFIPIIYLYLY